MKTKVMKLCSLLMALLVMTSLLAACGGGGDNPFLGAWDDDESEQSFIFNDDGTGAQTSYFGTIEFTYTWDGDTVTITNEEMGVSAEGYLEDGELTFGNSYCVKVDSAEYVPDNRQVGGSEADLNGTWSNDAGDIIIQFLGEGTFTYTNNQLGSGGSGTYVFDGETVIVTILDDTGEEADHEGYVDEYGTVVIDLWDGEVEYYPEDEITDHMDDDLLQDDTGYDESTGLDFWLGEYANDNGTLTIDNSGGTLYYALGYIGEDGASVASGTLSESGDPYVLEESDFIFRYDDSDNSIEVALQPDAGDYEHYTGWYYYVGPVGG